MINVKLYKIFLDKNIFSNQKLIKNQIGFTMIEALLALVMSVFIMISVFGILRFVRFKYEDFSIRSKTLTQLLVEEEVLRSLLQQATTKLPKGKEAPAKIIGNGSKKKLLFYADLNTRVACGTGLPFEIISLKIVKFNDKEQLICTSSHQNLKDKNINKNRYVFFSTYGNIEFNYSDDGYNWFNNWPLQEDKKVEQKPLIEDLSRKTFLEIVNDVRAQELIKAPLIKIKFTKEKMQFPIFWVMKLGNADIIFYPTSLNSEIKGDKNFLELNNDDKADIIIP